MLNVLIVDDELLVRNNLCSIIDWEGCGFTICGEAANGAAAVKLISECSPHIVILDISMPTMDGVELSRYINIHFPGIKMIVLSSYDNFDYVRETMKNGAVDYLLKHRIDSGILLNALEKARKDIETEEHRRDEQEKMIKRWGIINPAVVQTLIKELVLGINETFDGLEEYFDAVMPETGKGQFVTAVMQIVNFTVVSEISAKKDDGIFLRSVVDLCRQSLEEFSNGTVTYIEQGRFVLLFCFESKRSEASAHHVVRDCFSRLKSTIKRYVGLEVVFGTGPLCYELAQIPECYRKACKIIDDMFLLDHGYLLNTDNGQGIRAGQDQGGYVSLSIRQEKNLLAALDSCRHEEVLTIIKEVFEEMKTRNANYRSAQMCINELVNIAGKVSVKAGIKFDEILSDSGLAEKELGRCKRLEDVCTYVTRLFTHLLKALKDKQEVHYSEYVQKAVEYIQKKYSKDISLNEVAEAISISPSYLCRLFKEETKVSLIEYLNKLRIQEAMKLMGDRRRKVKEVYEAVGFNSYNYFFKVFKEETGLTPFEYVKKNN